MWNGEQWVSDFKQKSFWVAPQYEKEKCFRWIEKIAFFTYEKNYYHIYFNGFY